MCLIIASPNGKAPDMGIVSDAIIGNPHGWGAVSAAGGKLRADKGFGLPSLERAIRRMDGPYLIHFRYATHGAVGYANCHPFKVNRDCYMVHNGILKIPLRDSRYSDSWHFAADYARPYIATHGYGKLTADTEHFIGRGNKVAFIRGSGEILIANEFAGTWRDELWYSNDYSFPLDLGTDWWNSPVGDPLWPADDPTAPYPDALDSITFDSPEECEECYTPAMTLYLHPTTNTYVCTECVAVLAEMEEEMYR